MAHERHSDAFDQAANSHPATTTGAVVRPPVLLTTAVIAPSAIPTRRSPPPWAIRTPGAGSLVGFCRTGSSPDTNESARSTMCPSISSCPEVESDRIQRPPTEVRLYSSVDSPRVVDVTCSVCPGDEMFAETSCLASGEKAKTAPASSTLTTESGWNDIVGAEPASNRDNSARSKDHSSPVDEE